MISVMMTISIRREQSSGKMCGTDVWDGKRFQDRQMRLETQSNSHDNKCHLICLNKSRKMCDINTTSCRNINWL